VCVGQASPLISVVLTTRNRPQFFLLAIRYFRSQTYLSKELIIVDDSDQPVEPAVPEATYVRLPSPTPLGTKLNLGIERARGDWIAKMDDDDYYGRDFLQVMMGAAAHSDRAIYFVQPFLFFDLCKWEVRQADPDRCSGATLVFSKNTWRETPFRNHASGVDADFLMDHMSQNARPLALQPVNAVEDFLQVRHWGSHLWNNMPNGESLSSYLKRQRLYPKSPERLMPADVCRLYRILQSDRRV